MNILIFTGRFGMGHYSAAKAVSEEIGLSWSDADVKIIDILDFLIPRASRCVYSTFGLIVSRFSKLYNHFDKKLEKFNFIPLRSLVINKIDRLYGTFKPDIVISTLPVSTKYCAAYKRDRHCEVPLFTYITDICYNEEWIASGNDYYFVGSEGIRDSLKKYGIPEDKIVVSGIPVRQAFHNISARRPLGDEKKEILFMGGGLGLFPSMNRLFRALNGNPDSAIKTTVITGRNKRLYNSLRKKYPNLNIVGYTENVAEYMSRADILVSKAGGITLFEAIFSEIPIYVIHPFLLQEKGNAKYIESECLGKVLWNVGVDAVEDLLSLLERDAELEQMRGSIRKYKSRLAGRSALKQIIAACMGIRL